jgi:hypothetical protein
VTVLTQDIFVVPVSEIGNTEALLTFVGGRAVYGTGPYAADEGR